MSTKQSLYDFTVKDISGKDFAFSSLQGKAVIIVNVASHCGFTPQYKGLEELYREYKDKGLVIVGFPCNQFGSQEPGSEKDIQQFCSLTYDVSFPMMSKIDVNGENTAPIYRFLKSSATGLMGTEAIKWNFTKFLIGKNGQVIDRFAPQTEPKEMTKEIQQALD